MADVAREGFIQLARLLFQSPDFHVDAGRAQLFEATPAHLRIRIGHRGDHAMDARRHQGVGAWGRSRLVGVRLQIDVERPAACPSFGLFQRDNFRMLDAIPGMPTGADYVPVAVGDHRAHVRIRRRQPNSAACQFQCPVKMLFVRRVLGHAGENLSCQKGSVVPRKISIQERMEFPEYPALAPVARGEAPKRVVFNLRDGRAASTFRPASYWRHRVSIRITGRCSLPAEQPLKEFDQQPEPRLFFAVGHNLPHSNNESTNSRGSKGSKSPAFSPTPTYRTGSPSSRQIATTTPPLAVPSSLVNTIPVTPADSVNKRACCSPF